MCGLGNPGPEYDATRHNVGWWLVDRIAADWGLGPFQREGRAFVCAGPVGPHQVHLVKPRTYMNRSGAALAPFAHAGDFDVTRDLLVVVDDAALDVGRVRFRPGGSAGGHNGLKSVEQVLGTQEFARLRIGVGTPPDGVDLADWVLSGLPEEEEGQIVALLPDLAAGVRLWLDEGIEAAMNRYNRWQTN
ncbi:MAG TPA: aminoacyl-tRNA hydrolase [Longimicrobiales bacterium]|nr:aminoacyl-tRNA hydrolase [Longimicrobiales bacterium]